MVRGAETAADLKRGGVETVKRWLLLTLLIVFVSVGLIAQEKAGQNSVIDFSKGLVTAKNPLTQSFDEATVAWNVDFTRNPNELGPRLGYSERARVPLIDSFLWNGIYVAQYRGGEKEFLGIGQWTDSAWAGIFVSDPNEFGFGVVDSTILRPDTAEIRDSMQSLGHDDFDMSLTVTVGGYSWYITVHCLDSGVTPAKIVDSFVTRINASGAATYVTAYDLGDSLSVEEDNVEYQMSLVGSGSAPCWPYSYQPSGTYHSIGDPWVMRNIDNAIDSATVLTSRFPATGSPRFAQFMNKVYVVNGVGRGAVIANGAVAEFPYRAAGTPSILPLTTTGPTSGTFYYALQSMQPNIGDSLEGKLWNPNGGVPIDDSLASTCIGTLSTGVQVDSQQILLYDFPLFDSSAWYYDTLGEHGGWYRIWRSKGDIGSFDENDKLYLLDTIYVSDSVPGEYTDTTSDLTLTGRDSVSIMSDPEWSLSGSLLAGLGRISFGAGAYWAPNPADIGNDTTMPQVRLAVGAPIPLDTVFAADTGIWMGDGRVEWTDVLGFAWMVVPVDTLFNLVGDSSRSLRVWQPAEPDNWGAAVARLKNQFGTIIDSANAGFSRTYLGGLKLLMPSSAASANTMYLLYRGPVVPITLDSLYLTRWRYPEFAGQPGNYLQEYKKRFAAGSTVPAFYLIGQYAPGDIVTDTLHYDSLIARSIYQRSAVPTKMFDIVAAANRLIAIDENAVYMSDPVDSAVRFSVLQQRMVAPDAGDANTGIWEAGQGVVKIAKTKSLYDLYRSSGLWQLPELSKYYGMVAPLSHASAPEGDYFLSLDGVRLESEGVYKSRSFMGTLASSPLSNFNHMDASVMRTAIGIYHDNKYILSFPTLDTAFVLNKVMSNGQASFGWSQWGLCPVGATKYRVSDDNTIMPGDSLYFILSGDPKIYSWGNSEYDNGADVYWEWESGPSNPVSGNLWYPQSVALYLQSTETNDYAYSLKFVNDRDVVHGLLTNRLDTANWHEFDATDTTGESGALYWKLRIERNVLFSDTGTTSIQGLWFNVSPKERYGPQ
jgi:hypothetical protein